MTQKTIMSLPIRCIDFSDVRQTYYHHRIADLVDGIIASRKPPPVDVDAEIEHFVRELYGIDNPIANARIDSELDRISRFGSLLGSSIEVSDSGDEL